MTSLRLYFVLSPISPILFLLLQSSEMYVSITKSCFYFFFSFQILFSRNELQFLMDFMRPYLSDHVCDMGEHLVRVLYCSFLFLLVRALFDILYTGIILDDTYEPRSFLLLARQTDNCMGPTLSTTIDKIVCPPHTFNIIHFMSFLYIKQHKHKQSNCEPPK